MNEFSQILEPFPTLDPVLLPQDLLLRFFENGRDRSCCRIAEGSFQALGRGGKCPDKGQSFIIIATSKIEAKYSKLISNQASYCLCSNSNYSNRYNPTRNSILCCNSAPVNPKPRSSLSVIMDGLPGTPVCERWIGIRRGPLYKPE